jgi:hypothetical protein
MDIADNRDGGRDLEDVGFKSEHLGHFGHDSDACFV